MEKNAYRDENWCNDPTKTIGRIHIPGVNLTGKCFNSNCEGAKRSFVVCKQLGYGDFFVIKGSRPQIVGKCTACDSLVLPTLFAVNKCWYRVIQIREGDRVKITKPWEKVGDLCRIYEEDETVPTRDFKIECNRPENEPEEEEL